MMDVGDEELHGVLNEDGELMHVPEIFPAVAAAAEDEQEVERVVRVRIPEHAAVGDVCVAYLSRVPGGPELAYHITVPSGDRITPGQALEIPVASLGTDSFPRAGPWMAQQRGKKRKRRGGGGGSDQAAPHQKAKAPAGMLDETLVKALEAGDSTALAKFAACGIEGGERAAQIELLCDFFARHEPTKSRAEVRRHFSRKFVDTFGYPEPTVSQKSWEQISAEVKRKHGEPLPARPRNWASQFGQAARVAAHENHEEWLRLLHLVGAGASLSRRDRSGRTPGHLAAHAGHEGCLRALHELGAGDSLSAADKKGGSPAHYAAGGGHEGCLRALHELGASASLSAANAVEWTPADYAAHAGHEGCLRALHELGAGASLSASHKHGTTPAHLAAAHGHESCLRALNDLGAVSTFSMQCDTFGTPAHAAAGGGHARCLAILHECLSAAIGPALVGLQQFLPSMVDSSNAVHAAVTTLEKLKDIQGLRTSFQRLNTAGYLEDEETPAEVAAGFDHVQCLRVLVSIPRAMKRLLHAVRKHPEYLEDDARYECLLSEPGLLDLKTKQIWLSWRLKQMVGNNPDATQLSLVSDRSNILEGLCAQLGVDESSGHLVAGDAAATPFAVDVQFDGESASGSGLRRDWFRQTVTEILSPRHGLFVSKDGNRTVQPNPHSEIAGGADHLSYFALLGRITGLALYHREPLEAHWSAAFVKAVLGFEIKPEDLESVDPDLYEKRIVYLRDSVYSSRDGMALEDLGLVFADDSNDADYTQERGLGSVELKPGGSEIDVTEENKAEYLQLFATYRLLASIKPQVGAVQEGLAVFINEAMRTKIRKCCTVADVQLLMCGVATIDVDDWRSATKYMGCNATSQTVVWFWSVLSQMEPAQRASLLSFVTGSSRVPAGGFAALMGYGGQQQRFTLQLVPGREEEGSNNLNLPTAATCFNTLRLPSNYPSEVALKEALCVAVGMSQGFHEGAVAE